MKPFKRTFRKPKEKINIHEEVRKAQETCDAVCTAMYKTLGNIKAWLLLYEGMDEPYVCQEDVPPRIQDGIYILYVNGKRSGVMDDVWSPRTDEHFALTARDWWRHA
jgi:hypothetical protein